MEMTMEALIRNLRPVYGIHRRREVVPKSL
jgi:hypothetical protein